MNSLLHQHTESIVSAAIHAGLPDVAVVRALLTVWGIVLRMAWLLQSMGI